MKYSINVVQLTSDDGLVLGSIARSGLCSENGCGSGNNEFIMDHLIEMFCAGICKGGHIYVPEADFHRALNHLRSFVSDVDCPSVTDLLKKFESAAILPITDLIDYYELNDTQDGLVLIDLDDYDANAQNSLPISDYHS